jgi:hypothetical protein
VGPEERGRQDVHRPRVGHGRTDARERQAVRERQRLGDLLLGALARLDEDLAEQLLVPAPPLLVERRVEPRLLEHAAADEELPEGLSVER